MISRRAEVLLAAVFAVTLFCGSGAVAQQEVPSNGPAVADKSAAMSRVDTDRPQPAQRNPRYRISRADVMEISFPLSPELNQKVTVQPDGFISLQSAGNIQVLGLTLPELISAVKKAYTGILHDPIVNVELIDFQKPSFTVLGQVGKPGRYDLRDDITVTQGIAIAGGFADTGKTQVFLFRAVSSDWAEVREVKLQKLLSGKNIAEDMHLQPGDMIYVPERFITKFKRYVPYSFSLIPPYKTY